MKLTIHMYDVLEHKENIPSSVSFENSLLVSDSAHHSVQ